MNDPAATTPENEDALFEQLVAYLDGELDPESVREVEQRLANDPSARRLLRDLQSSWDMLDELPKAEVSANFTQTTVSMVAVRAAEETAHSRGNNWRRSGKWLAGAVALLASALLGYVTVQSVYSQPDRQLLRDLPVIENLDMYQSAENVRFLRSLAQEGLFDEESGDEL
jgi:anti-sigma factor RsiW